MINLNIDTTKFTGLQQGLKNAPSVLDKNLSIAIDQSVQAIDRNLAIPWIAGGYGIPVGKITTKDHKAGTLRATRFQRLMSIGGVLRGEIGTTEDYGIYVHEGTYKMRARPYLEKSVEKALPIIEKHFEDAILKTIKSI